MAGKESLYSLIGEAVMNRLQKANAATPARAAGGERQEWQPPMSEEYGKSQGMVMPWEAEIQDYMARGSQGPMPYSYGEPDMWSQGTGRWAYSDGFGNPQPYGKYAGSYGGPQDPTIYRQFMENGRRVGGREPK